MVPFCVGIFIPHPHSVCTTFCVCKPLPVTEHQRNLGVTKSVLEHRTCQFADFGHLQMCSASNGGGIYLVKSTSFVSTVLVINWESFPSIKGQFLLSKRAKTSNELPN